MGLLDKPAAGTPINTSHPLAPRAATGLLWAFLDNTATTVVDNFQGDVFTRQGTDGGPNWSAASFPGTAGGSALDLVRTHPGVPGLSKYNNTTGPTGTPAYTTLAVILKVRGTTNDGPRTVGSGAATGIALEPCFAATGKLYALNGGVAHVNTTLDVPLNAWVFAAICWRSTQYIDAYVYNYDSGVGASARVPYAPALTSSNGEIYLGSSTTGTQQNGTNGLLYWAMYDPSEWSVADLTSLAASPFAMFAASLTAGVVSTSGETESTIEVSTGAATGGTAPYTYKLQIAPDSGGSPGTWADVGSYQSGTSWTATGLSPSVTYWFRVLVLDSAGSPGSATSAAVSATTDASGVAVSPPAPIWFPGLSARLRRS